MATETKAAFARRHGVNRSTVNKWETKGRLVMTGDGLVNVEGSEQLLTGRPTIYRGGQAKGPTAQEMPEHVSPNLGSSVPSDPTEIVVAALSAVVSEIGVRVATRAAEFGAPLKVAYALDVAACVEAAWIGERFLASVGAPIAAGTSLVEIVDTEGPGIAEPDWAALAQQAGETLDLDAIEEWFTRLPFPDAPID
jgi:hypothetical protein